MASTVWRGFITFGLISIPVRLFRAARAERVSLRRVQRVPVAQRSEREETLDDGSDESNGDQINAEKLKGKVRAIDGAASAETVLEPVKQAFVRSTAESEAQRTIPQSAISKGYEYQKGSYVAVSDEELKSIVPKTSSEMGIEEFVRLADVDPVYFETSYYVVPEDAGQKAFGLLYRSLKTTGLVAVAQMAMHGRDHVVIVRPGKQGLIAHTMFFSPEVHADEEYRTQADLVSAKELTLAETLIRSLEAKFEPDKYRDTYRERLQTLLEGKVAGAAQPASRPATRQGVVDITEALQQSLAKLKKPAKSVRPAAKRASGRSSAS